tara:strand:+ start:8893 stop:10038 length:1146 start_codon:yes stop_codon:yes gene_type:complete
MVDAYFPYAQKKMGFDVPVTIVFESDQENAKNPLGKTAYYDPSNYKVVLYVDNRHPKDVMRSLSHELVHHKQNCNGELEGITGEQGYAQTEHGHRIEEEAYSLGSTCFRNWEDSVKKRINETTYSKRRKTMNEDAIRTVVRRVISESQTLKKYFIDKVQLKEEGEIWSPNHYCIHHGGVNHNGKVEMAEAIQHNYNEELDRVTHYDMKLSDGTILENVPFEEIQVTNASLAEGHGAHAAKRDGDKKKKEKKKDKKLKKFVKKAAKELDENCGCPDLVDEAVEEGLGEEPVNCEEIMKDQEAKWEEVERLYGQDYPELMQQAHAEASTLANKHPECWEKKKTTVQSSAKFGGLGESKKKPLKEWYGNSLYKKLLKEYTGGKK